MPPQLPLLETRCVTCGTPGHSAKVPLAIVAGTSLGLLPLQKLLLPAVLLATCLGNPLLDSSTDHFRPKALKCYIFLGVDLRVWTSKELLKVHMKQSLKLNPVN